MDIFCPNCNLESKPFHETPSCMLIHLTTPPRPIIILIVLTLAKDGIGDGQLDFESLREDVAQNFLPWKDTRTGLEKAAPWLAAAFSTAAAFVPFGFAVGGAVRGVEQTLVAGVSSAGGAFAGGAFAQIGRDPAILPMLVAFIFCFRFASGVGNRGSREISIERMAQLSQMGKFVADYCSTARDILGKWSTVIFQGGKDKSGRDILFVPHVFVVAWF